MPKYVTGIDIGGTHITVAIADIETGELLPDSIARDHIDTTVKRDAIIDSWCRTIARSHASAQLPLTAIGIAMPGPFDYERGISYMRGLHKYEDLYGQNVRNLLSAHTGTTPENIHFINDASAFLLGEMRAGAAKGFSNVVGITLGTGLGSAVYYRGELIEGDLYCSDFGSGKCEDFVSARWLIGEYERQSGIRAGGAKEIAERCISDPLARETFTRFGSNLFKALFARYAEQSPEIVVIGGNISKAWQHFIPAVKARMAETGFQPKLAPAQLGEHAALIGAACLCDVRI